MTLILCRGHFEYGTRLWLWVLISCGKAWLVCPRLMPACIREVQVQIPIEHVSSGSLVDRHLLSRKRSGVSSSRLIWVHVAARDPVSCFRGARPSSCRWFSGSRCCLGWLSACIPGSRKDRKDDFLQRLPEEVSACLTGRTSSSGQTYLHERLGDVFCELMAMCLSKPGVMSLRGAGEVGARRQAAGSVTPPFYPLAVATSPGPAVKPSGCLQAGALSRSSLTPGRPQSCSLNDAREVRQSSRHQCADERSCCKET